MSAIWRAKARTNGHRPCCNAAMANGKRRLHGGLCTGAKTPEGRRKQREANIKHGFYTAEAVLERKETRALIRELNGSL